MIKKNLLLSAGAFALLAGLASAPATAQGDTPGEIATEAQGDFTGFVGAPVMVARSFNQSDLNFDIGS